jgi:hypothetical protein
MMMENATRFCNAMNVMDTPDLTENFSRHILIAVRIAPQQMEKIGESGSGMFLGFDDDSGVIMVKETKTVIIIPKEDMGEAIEMVVNHESNELVVGIK